MSLTCRVVILGLYAHFCAGMCPAEEGAKNPAWEFAAVDPRAVCGSLSLYIAAKLINHPVEIRDSLGLYKDSDRKGISLETMEGFLKEKAIPFRTLKMNLVDLPKIGPGVAVVLKNASVTEPGHFVVAEMESGDRIRWLDYPRSPRVETAKNLVSEKLHVVFLGPEFFKVDGYSHQRARRSLFNMGLGGVMVCTGLAALLCFTGKPRRPVC